jgi:biofilm protein TabA
MVVDTLENWRLHAAHPGVIRAFEWLEKADLAALPEGRTEIAEGELAAILQTNPTKPRGQGRLEAHRKFIDIQYVVEGEEAMGWAPLEGLDEDGPFDEGADIGFYRGACDLVPVRAGSFAVFYPHDAHMPCIDPLTGPKTSKKVVLKVLA